MKIKVCLFYYSGYDSYLKDKVIEASSVKEAISTLVSFVERLREEGYRDGYTVTTMPKGVMDYARTCISFEDEKEGKDDTPCRLITEEKIWVIHN